MENTESTELPPREKLEQLLSELRGKAESGETLNQLVSGIEQLMSTITLNHDLGKSTSAEAEAKDDDEYATVYFRLCFTGDWFTIPPRGGVNAMYSVGKEPQYSMSSSRVVPLALCHYLVLIIMQDQYLDLDQPKSRDEIKHILSYQNTDVYYLAVLHTDAGWKKAARRFLGYLRCFYFAANNKVYRLECSKDDIFSFKCLDFGCLDKDWQPHPLTKPPAFVPSNNSAFMIEYQEGDTGLVFFTEDCFISYHLETSTFSVFKVPIYDTGYGGVRYFNCKPVCVGDTMYMLCQKQQSFNLMAYSHLNHTWCPTPVIGLDEDMVFPFYYPDEVAIPTRLLHLGKQRLCLIWPFTTGPGPTTRVCCTKFDVSEDKEKHYAKVVFKEEYKIKGYGRQKFEAISIRK